MAIVYWEEKGTELTPLEVDENFRDLDDRATQLRTDVDLKADANLMAQPEGIATLNNVSKLIQTALNSDKLDGKTFAQIAELFIAAVAKGAANGIAELDETGVLKAAQRPISGEDYQGAWDADGNIPAIPDAESANTGYFYKVSVAGATSIDGINTWNIGDEVRSNGLVWERIPAFSSVNSVAGKTGIINLEISDIVGLISSLSNKVDKISEIHIANMDELNAPGVYYLDNLIGIANIPVDVGTGKAKITVETWGPVVWVNIHTQSNDTFTRYFDGGTWSSWNKLN